MSKEEQRERQRAKWREANQRYRARHYARVAEINRISRRKAYKTASVSLTFGDCPEKFWNQVDRRGPDECWPWRGSFWRDGYGKVFLRGGTPRRAHRVALELSGGLPDKTLLACHKCDNKPCCNPSHMFAGTYSDNTRDAIAKGRHYQTGKLSRPLTTEQVIFAFTDPRPAPVIARLIGADKAVVYFIRKRKTYRDVTERLSV